MKEQGITLHKYELTDFGSFKALVTDGELMKYVSGKPWTESDAIAKFKIVIETNNKERVLGFFKVFNQENGDIGYCKLERHPNDNSVLEVGYMLKKEFWGKGFGTSICIKLLSLASKSYPELDIIAIIDPENQASKRILQKARFESYFIGIEDELPTEKLILRSSRSAT